jgi:hypothetical protein
MAVSLLWIGIKTASQFVRSPTLQHWDSRSFLPPQGHFTAQLYLWTSHRETQIHPIGANLSLRCPPSRVILLNTSQITRSYLVSILMKFISSLTSNADITFCGEASLLTCRLKQIIKTNQVTGPATHIIRQIVPAPARPGWWIRLILLWDSITFLHLLCLKWSYRMRLG